MDLKLVLTNSTGIVWLGVSGKQLGKLGPNTSMDIKLQLIPTIPGLQVGLLYMMAYRALARSSELGVILFYPIASGSCYRRRRNSL